MARDPVSDPKLAEFGKFLGQIEHSSNFRQQALNHNLERNVRVLRLLSQLGKLLRSGSQLTGAIECTAAIRQNFQSSRTMTRLGLPMGPAEAAHFLPGQIRIGGREIWQFATSSSARGQIEFLFAEVEHLPAAFNQADSAAEAKGQPVGLCAALVSACEEVINRWHSHRPAASGSSLQHSQLAHVPHPNSPAGRAFDWGSVGLPHPHSPAGRAFDWASVGLPHPDSPAAGAGADAVRCEDSGPPHAALVQAGFEAWHRGAIAGLTKALAMKQGKPGIPPLVGDRFEGYTEESVALRSQASKTLWNRDESIRILGYYLEDQRQRTWSEMTSHFPDWAD